METEILDITMCKDGDVIAEDIIGRYGAVIVNAQTAVNRYIISKLFENGIRRIKVHRTSRGFQEEKFLKIKKKYDQNMIMTKELIYNLMEGKKIDFRMLEEITDSICEIGNDSNIMGCLLKIQTVDEYTYYHSINVSIYSILLAGWMNLREEDVKNIATAGLLHDMGKTEVPLEILNKPGSLTSEEFEIIKKHALCGYELISGIDGINTEIKESILMHHEREDGTGYPNGIKTGQITKMGKILAIADVYDAMTSNRVYKKGNTPFEAFEMFRTQGITKFDSDVVSVLLKNLSTYYVGINVILNSGERGRIVYIPPHSVTSPVVKTESEYLDLSLNENVKIVKCFP